MLINDIHISDERLQKIRIGLSDVDPQSDPPNLSNYKLCTYYANIVGAGETKAFYCDNGAVMGRYLIVQTELTNVLTLCEVQAYESELSYFALCCIPPPM